MIDKFPGLLSAMEKNLEELKGENDSLADTELGKMLESSMERTARNTIRAEIENMKNQMQQIGGRKMTEHDDYEKQLEEERLDQIEADMMELQSWYPKLAKRNLDRSIAQVKADSALMDGLKRRGITPEQFVEIRNSPEGQRIVQEAWERGTNKVLDDFFGPEPAQPSQPRAQQGQPGAQQEQPRQRSNVPYAKELDRATENRGVGDRDLENLLKVVMPDDDQLLKYGVTDAPDVRKKRGRK